MKLATLNSSKKGTLAVKKYVQAIQGQHVLPSKDGWKVKRSGAAKASSVHVTQKQAISYAKKLAQSQKVELFIHDKKGEIREKNSYGKDNFPPKG